VALAEFRRGAHIQHRTLAQEEAFDRGGLGHGSWECLT
jgi:hypothetical protein